jgi:hypothetical protein
MEDEYMNIIKNQLTFAETIQFVNSVVDSVFSQDENGNDIDYSPASLYPLIQATFAEYYTDLVFLPTTDEDGNEIEGNFDKNFAEYIVIDIYSLEGFDHDQFNAIKRAINETIDFRKQKMLQKDNEVSKLVADLLKEQIEATKLQKKAINDMIKMNSQYQKKDIDKILKVVGQLNKNMKNPEYQKAFVDEVVSLQKDTEVKDGE